MYNATIKRDYELDEHKIQYDGTESDLWKQIAILVKDSHIPNSMSVDSEHGYASINVKQRGSYIENGVKYPSMFVTVKNHIDLPPSTYEKAYLTCIHAESNNYKAYILRPEGSDIWADYGSIDDVHNGNARTVQTPYASYLYWIRYYEKLSKGYKDQSEIFFDTPVVKTEQKKEFDFVLSHVNDELKSKVRKVWKVIPKKQKEMFDSYCKKRNISNIKYFWHGSRNENWESIIRQGLLLNPNAVITGKMFGNGIYFAPSARKSYGYTSCCGSYWARGNDTVGFMGLYATAYGDPYYPRSSGNMKPYMDRDKKDCVHARKADVGLYNDEVIFYNENAMCLSYFVEFSA